MQTYASFSPTGFDHHINFEDSRESWLILLSQNRDSDCLTRSNFTCALEALGGESETVEVHRFGHWGCGWFELILVDPNSPQAQIAQDIENALSDYPVLNEEHFSELEELEALQVWQNCYSPKDRIRYIRENRRQFEFNSYQDLRAVIRGEYFNGYASELLY